MGESVLSRASFSNATVSLTPVQSEVDGAVGSFKEGLTEPSFVVSSLVGAGVYGGIRLGGLKARQSYRPNMTAYNEIKILFTNLATIAGGMMVAPIAYEVSRRTYQSFTEAGSKDSALWTWNGQGGVREGLNRSISILGPAYWHGDLGAWLGSVLTMKKPGIVRLGAGGVLAFLGFVIGYDIFLSVYRWRNP